jgi:hypothetical protein
MYNRGLEHEKTRYFLTIIQTDKLVKNIIFKLEVIG